MVESAAALILARMVEAYASLTSYGDEGEVRRVDDHDDAGEVRFVTRFTRPNLFRFDFNLGHPYPPLRHIRWKHAIWFDGSRAFSWKDYGDGANRVVQEDSLRTAVARTAGISRGSAHTIAKLFFPSIPGVGVHELANPELRGTESHEGKMCHKVGATHPSLGTQALWIDTETHLLRKIRTTILGVAHEESRTNMMTNGPMSLDDFNQPFS